MSPTSYLTAPPRNLILAAGEFPRQAAAVEDSQRLRSMPDARGWRSGIRSVAGCGIPVGEPLPGWVPTSFFQRVGQFRAVSGHCDREPSGLRALLRPMAKRDSDRFDSGRGSNRDVRGCTVAGRRLRSHADPSAPPTVIRPFAKRRAPSIQAAAAPSSAARRRPPGLLETSAACPAWRCDGRTPSPRDRTAPADCRRD